MQGFPLHPRTKPTVDLCSFHTALDVPRHPRRVGEQAGNSMNLAVLQLVQLHGYLSLQPRPVPTLLSMVRVFKHKADEERRGRKRRLRSKTPARQATWAREQH